MMLKNNFCSADVIVTETDRTDGTVFIRLNFSNVLEYAFVNA